MFIDYIDRFENDYLCKPYLDEQWSKIREAVKEYEDECESFDRLICSGRKDGIAIPMNGRELAIINVHARKVRQEVQSRYCIDWNQFQEGMKFFH